MANADDVAAYILQRLDGSCSTMKLQKLLYYCQGWSLAWDEVPLFADEIEAWANGPVVYNIFTKHRGRFSVSEWDRGDPANLTASERETVDAVVDHYATYSGRQLADMSHEERPWIEARGDTPEGARSAATIDLSVMQDFFGSLAGRQ